jgi:hypothetical protein
MLKVLIACEESQAVCKAFRKRGFEAYSCDIQPCSGGHPEWHIQSDIFEVLVAIKFYTQDAKAHYVNEWDLVIAHPPCTYLTVTGLRWLYSDKTKSMPHPKYPNRLKDQEDAVRFFMKLAAYEGRIAIENPVCIMSSRWRKPDQIIHPWQFGHNASKKTCLWLNGLPKLEPTDIVECTFRTTSTGKRFDTWYWETSKLKGKDRQKERSKTFQGIAEAMAQQWGDYLLSENKHQQLLLSF